MSVSENNDTTSDDDAVKLDPIEPIHQPKFLDEGAPSALPWRECGCGKCGLIWDATGNANVAIACDEWGDSRDDVYGRVGEKRRRANARLIVASGSLLAALKEACDVLDSCADIMERESLSDEDELSDERERIKGFRAVIEYAEGKRDRSDEGDE